MNNNSLENQHPLPLQWLTQGLVLLSFITYLCCLFQPAYRMGEGHEPSAFISGIFALFWGAFSVLLKEPYWLANPLLWITWSLYFGKARKLGALFGIASILLAGSFLFGEKVLVGCFDSCNFTTYHVEQGYYCWLASMILATIALIIDSLRNTK